MSSPISQRSPVVSFLSFLTFFLWLHRRANFSTEVDMLSADRSATRLSHLVQVVCHYYKLVSGPVAVSCAVSSACLAQGLFGSVGRLLLGYCSYSTDEETEAQTS